MPSLRRPLRCPVRRGDGGDRLFCRHIFSLSPPFGKDLFTQETLRLLDEVGATKTVHQWERGITGFAVAFCGSPQSRCPCWLSLTCDKDRKSTRLNSSHTVISYAVFCLKKKKQQQYRLQHS